MSTSVSVRVIAHPGGTAVPASLAHRYVGHDRRNLGLVGDNPPAVQTREGDPADEGDALVAVVDVQMLDRFAG